ncbi:hypothetical protein GTW69_14705 [Streptomyces sp. SID7760]|nr:hypothetical protein [Streptomyces sp. SID7760]
MDIVIPDSRQFRLLSMRTKTCLTQMRGPPPMGGSSSPLQRIGRSCDGTGILGHTGEDDDGDQNAARDRRTVIPVLYGDKLRAGTGCCTWTRRRPTKVRTSGAAAQSALAIV